jgi:hypothetical protein
MMTPVEIEQKVRQLDNDVQAIYAMLADIAATQTRHGNRLAEIDGKLIETDSKITGLDTKLDTILGLLNGARPTDSCQRRRTTTGEDGPVRPERKGSSPGW